MTKLMMTLLGLVALNVSFAGTDSLELTCKNVHERYEVTAFYDCMVCMGPANREVGSMGASAPSAVGYDRAFVRNMLNNYGIELHRGEFMLQKIDGQYFFAGLRDSLLLKCEEKKASLHFVKGSLVRVHAIGGETSGIGIRDNSLPTREITELKGANPAIQAKLENLIGATVAVEGRYETVHSVERGSYQALVVESVAEMAIRPQSL